MRQRLLTLSRATGQTLDLLLTRYVLERLLYRLSQTPHRERFVLKGAMLMTTWFTDPHRPTRDVDFLGFGDPVPDALLAVFRDVCASVQDDGVTVETAWKRRRCRENGIPAIGQGQGTLVRGTGITSYPLPATPRRLRYSG
ncbi:MAG TPA: nucleotidyl transferase AbiEii/AbiGii toxin family protein [Arenibaculum sp.]|nr:nucleotidyl transferase AbiEii/AbiGii toxin family protein [Arenibaculum sp.]